MRLVKGTRRKVEGTIQPAGKTSLHDPKHRGNRQDNPAFDFRHSTFDSARQGKMVTGRPLPTRVCNSSMSLSDSPRPVGGLAAAPGVLSETIHVATADSLCLLVPLPGALKREGVAYRNRTTSFRRLGVKRISAISIFLAVEVHVMQLRLMLLKNLDT